MWGGMMDWGGYGWGMFGVLHMLLWWILIILGIVVLVRWLVGGGHGGRHHPSEDKALSVLRERYARGDIDKSEYEARKKDLLS